MKFTDGNWLMRAGVKAHYASQAYDIEKSDRSLTIYAPTRNINHRGDTLGGPLLTINISSPMADVIRLKVSHFTGGLDNLPHFPLFKDDAQPEISIDEDFAEVKSGALSAKINLKNWAIDYIADGNRLTGSGWRNIGYVETADEGVFVHEQLQLGVGECVYGLGERFTAFVKNGQVVDIWNKDGGTGSDQAYKNVPFYLTNRGYGVFVNDTGNVSFEVATEKVSRVQFSVPGQELEYFIIYGPTPKDILNKYTELTGRPALPPAWTFGLWLTTSFTTNYDEKTVTSILDEMRDRDLPLHVFHFDCFWMKDFHWCDLKWDERTFPNPKEMLQRLKERGLHICAWINPYIAQRSYLFNEGKQLGYLLKKADGSVWQTDDWQPGMGIVDFTNPDACKWYAGKLAELMDMGVDSFKTDFGERIPLDVVYHNNADPERMHNYYTYLYNKTVFNLLVEKCGVGEAALFARSGTAGCQQFPIHWGGDCYSNFESMAESLRGGLSLCLSGYGFWSHDIGGFEGTPRAEIYKRWVAFGLLSSHSRLHGSSSYRVPWLFDEEACDVLRHFTKLKCKLMPYFYAKAVEAHETGAPVMRAMFVEYPNDPSCDYLDRQYMLGESLLAAPVFSSDGSVKYYLPKGRWTEFTTGRVLEGGTWVNEKHGFLSAPLLVRPNSVIPVGSIDTKPDYDYAKDVVFQAYELADGELKTVVPALDGSAAMTLTVVKSGASITASVDKGSAWKLLLAGVKSVKEVNGGKYEATDQGILITPDANVLTIKTLL